jgi:S-DNA-T family DNA segregation ATPase FtsK/SpoIIIE
MASNNGGRARGTGGSGRSAVTPPGYRLLAQAGVLALFGVWAFVGVSLISFNVGDAPTHAVWPVNEPTRNWAGPAGAATAYGLFRVLGYAVWVPMAAALLGLIKWMSSFQTGEGVDQPVIRAVGAVLTAAAAAALASVMVPAWGPLPGLPGGTLGLAIAGSLVPGLSVLGTLLLLGVLLVIGLVVAFDHMVFAVPGAVWRRVIRPAAERTAPVAGGVVKEAAAITARGTKRTGGGVLAGVRGLLARFAGGSTAKTKTRKPKPGTRVALNDLGEEAEVGAAALEEAEGARVISRRKAKKPAVVEELEQIEAEADEEADELEEGEEDEAGDEDAEDGEELAEDDDAETVGAPQVFDREALKQKIAALPVRFAHANKAIATAEDLADIQNAANLEGYRFPGLDLLEEPEEGFNAKLESLVRDQAESLEAALRQYKVEAEVVDIESGPAITLYHLKLAPGTKVAAVQAVSSDVARALKAVNIRVVSNMEGRDTVGVEVPNPTKERVRLKELMGNRELFGKMKLPMFLGKDAAGDPLIADLTKMPHMLIAGTTGSGKSVCMNTIIMSFLYTRKPNELKLVLVDPKMVEMSQFKDIPHLMCPVVTEMSKAAAILEWAVQKMDERYELLADAGCRDIASYNALDFEELCERLAPPGTDGLSDEEKARVPRQLPYMVFIIDELADLMMTHKEVEGSIIRIAQKARAVGIHLILATQRPQANVVTGLIKSNMPCRVTFKVASGMDSRIVLDSKGGELLLGQGDMLFLNPSSHKLMRAQGTLVDDAEIRKVVKFLKEVAAPSFERQLVQLRGPAGSDEERAFQSENHSSASLAAAQEDPLFDRAVEIVLETKRGSVSLLQRRLAIGYTRASRLIDLMGIAGIISDHKGSVARDVLISPEEWEAIKALANEEAAKLGVARIGENLPAGAHKDDAEQQALFDAGGGVEVEEAPFETDDDEGEADKADAEEAEYEDGEEEEEEYEEEEYEEEDEAQASADDDEEYEEEDAVDAEADDEDGEDGEDEDDAAEDEAEEDAEAAAEDDSEEEELEAEDDEEVQDEPEPVVKRRAPGGRRESAA